MFEIVRCPSAAAATGDEHKRGASALRRELTNGTGTLRATRGGIAGWAAAATAGRGATGAEVPFRAVVCVPWT